MPKVYSADFRLQAIRCVERGKSREEVCDFFGIGSGTLSRWLSQYREDGSLTCNARAGYAVRKVDRELLRQRVAASPDATLQEWADHFGTHPSVIDYHLRKLRITRKKNHALRGAKRSGSTNVHSRDRNHRSRESRVPG